jgi:flagellar biosynthesis protein FliQ
MTPEQTLALSSHALEIAIYMAGPLLIVALVIGLIVSIFQAATQINEATLSFIPKLLGIMVTLIIAGPWMLSVFSDYFRTTISSIANFGG